MVESRTRDPEVLGSNSGVGKKENLSQVQSEQYHHQSLCTRVKYLKLSEVKTRSRHGAVVECRTRDPEVPGSNPSVAKKENLSQVQSEQYHHQSLCTRVKYLKLSEVKTRSRFGSVVECRTRDPEVPGSNPGVAKKENLSQVQSEQYHHQSLCTRVKYLKLSEVKTRSHRGTVVECRTRDPEVPGSNPSVAKKENLSQVQSEQYHHQSLCTRVKYLKLSEVKTRSHRGTLVECRTRDPEVPGSNPGVAKKENLSQVQSEQYHHQSLCTRVKYLKLSEVKTRSHCGAVVEWRTRDPEVPGSNPGVAKKENLSQVQSEQYHHTSLCTRVKYLKLSEVKTRSHRGSVVECRTRDPEVPGSNPGVAKKENLSQVQSEQYHHQSLCTRVKYLKLSEVKTRSRRGSVVECRTRDPDSPGFKPWRGQKRKSLTGPIRTIPPPIPLHQS